MRKPKTKLKTDIGIVVGRFQVGELHEAHKQLIDLVKKNHGRAAIFLGVSQVMDSEYDPMDYPIREAMIKAAYPNLIVVPMPDCFSDLLWSRNLDKRIRELFPVGTISLYGGRDSFIRHYKGAFNTIEIEPVCYVSGTNMRKQISNQVLADVSFRSGVIHKVCNQYHNPKPTADIAVLRMDGGPQVLLCQKADEIASQQIGEGEFWRFIGGFASSKDMSYEETAKRELGEEAGFMEVSDLEYVCSHQIDDWRYRNTITKIITSFFVTAHLFGAPAPGDDIAKLQWFPLTAELERQIRAEHAPLYRKLLTHVRLKDVNGMAFCPTSPKLKKG